MDGGQRGDFKQNNDTIMQLESAGEILVDLYKNTLVQNRKFATKKTHRSIEYKIIISPTEIKIQILSNISLLFIEKGRRKGAKLPVKKVGGKFELVDELKEWVKAVGYGGSHYVLAKRISERGIKGTPITAIVIAKLGNKLDKLISEYFAEQEIIFLRKEMRSIFEGV